MPTQHLYPYLAVHDASAAIAFYQQAFGATERFRLAEPSGKIGHAELDFDGATLLLADEYPDHGHLAPAPGRALSLHLRVDDADATIERAVDAGATLEREAADQLFGQRSGSVLDPFGHRWLIAHTTEEVSPEVMQARWNQELEG